MHTMHDLASASASSHDIRQAGDSSHNRSSCSFDAEIRELEQWIKRWRWANRISANGAAGVKGLTNLGLFKVETLLNNLDQTERTNT